MTIGRKDSEFHPMLRRLRYLSIAAPYMAPPSATRYNLGINKYARQLFNESGFPARFFIEQYVCFITSLRERNLSARFCILWVGGLTNSEPKKQK